MVKKTPNDVAENFSIREEPADPCNTSYNNEEVGFSASLHQTT